MPSVSKSDALMALWLAHRAEYLATFLEFVSDDSALATKSLVDFEREALKAAGYGEEASPRSGTAA